MLGRRVVRLPTERTWLAAIGLMLFALLVVAVVILFGLASMAGVVNDTSLAVAQLMGRVHGLENISATMLAEYGKVPGVEQQVATMRRNLEALRARLQAEGIEVTMGNGWLQYESEVRP